MLRTTRPRRLLALVIASLFVLAACGDDDTDTVARTGLPPSTTSSTGAAAAEPGEPALDIASPGNGDTVAGNVVTLELEVREIEIVSADGDTSGATGHFHVFVDRDPPPVGEVIERGPGIIHTTESSVVVPGLSPGEHRFVVTLGDGTHARISEELTAQVEVVVEGPSISASAESPVQDGDDVVVEVATEGITLGGADGAHLHFIVDGDLPAPGETIPQGVPGVIHSQETTVAIPDLPPGDHVIWVVVGDAAHAAWDPPVAARVTVTVE